MTALQPALDTGPSHAGRTLAEAYSLVRPSGPREAPPRRPRALSVVGAVMAEAVCVHEDRPVDEIVRLFLTRPDLGVCAVVDRAQRAVGMVEPRDLLVNARTASTPVRSVMAWPLVLSLHATTARAARLLAWERARYALVAESHGRVVGQVSALELLTALPSP
jgi:predicted transcriptional regulator